jgi:GT2 family glycosyltransferase
MNANLNDKSLVTVVIVTYNRYSEVIDCLTALESQTYPVSEVILVDNGYLKPNESLEEIISRISFSFQIKYFVGKTNSLTIARNFAVSMVTTEYCCLVDDDVILPANYLEVILNGLRELPKAVGAHGKIIREKTSRLKNIYSKLFLLFYLSNYDCKLLKSMYVSYPYYCKLSNPIECQWVSGSNQVYRTDVLRNIKWDEKMIKYSDGEDVDHSYRIYKSGVGKLYFFPNVKVKHTQSIKSRAIGFESILMRETYMFYLMYKLLEPSLGSIILFLWSRLGEVTEIFIRVIFQSDKILKFRELIHLFKSFKYTFKYRKELKSGELDSINIFIKKFNGI